MLEDAGCHGVEGNDPGGPPMTYMLCRNRVTDFTKWKDAFDSHAPAHREAGLRLANLWRSVEEPDNVFFMFEVADLERARAFIGDPAAAEAGKAAGVIDGEYHFLESDPARGYLPVE
jgi:hypothetical protein